MVAMKGCHHSLSSGRHAFM